MKLGWSGAALLLSAALHVVVAWGVLRAAPLPVVPSRQVVAIDVVDRAGGAVGGGSMTRAASSGVSVRRRGRGRTRSVPMLTPTPASTPTPAVGVVAAAFLADVTPPSGSSPAVSGRGDGAGSAEGGAGPGVGTGDGFGHGAAVASGRGLDLAPFLERLRRSAEACAPRRHRQGGETTALVRFCVGPGGAATSVALLESTGSSELDRATLDCVIPGAMPFPPADRCLVVPLRFQ